MITEATPTSATSSVQERITFRAFVQAVAMIHMANHRKDKGVGDPKVGGHPAACASAMHTLAALHLDVREPADFVCCKPHASPVDHALHHHLGLFRMDEHVDWFRGGAETGEAYPRWFTEDEAKQAMECLRRFPSADRPHTFQSYHARTDGDNFHFLPSGTVGIPPVVSGYLALAYRYAKDHGWEVPENAHFWSLIGDSEFREGSLLEAMPDFGERMLGNVTWIIDYNRQNLDGTRMPNEKGLEGRDCDRIEKTALANGWRVIQVRHGKLRREVFSQPGGDALREVFEHGLTDYEYQVLALKRDAGWVRKVCAAKHPGCRALLESLDDAEVLRLLVDLGGHDYEQLVDALRRSREETDEPYLVIVHSLKGWGLECLADPANHSTLPDEKEVHALLAKAGLEQADPFALFSEDSEEARFLAARRDVFRAGIEEHDALRARNKGRVQKALDSHAGFPDSLDIDLSLFPIAHTQWMWGQLAAKLVRLGSANSNARSGRRTTDLQAARDLTEHEQRWAAAAEFVMTMSPDVGTSTNISGVLNERIYGPERADKSFSAEIDLKIKHPELTAHQDAWTRHIRFEIAEANAMTAVGSFGKMATYVGLPFFPIMTVYDFFIKRALDQLYYNLYWGAEFVVMGTPSGVTLSPEGAQHSWKSDIQIPNLITWEPMYALEMDWILSDALKRQVLGDNQGRTGVLIRAVTRAIPQKGLLEQARKQARFKAQDVGALAPKGSGWADATDESTVPAQPDEAILATLREDVLAGAYYLVDWRGYAGYEPGENVVHVFAMGSLTDGAVQAAEALLARGVFANVIHVSSPELLVGILGDRSGYAHLIEGLGVNGDLHLVPSANGNGGVAHAGLVGLAGRRVPLVAVCDGEAGLVDNIGSIIGVRQETLAVRKFSKCGRPDEIFAYQHLDAESIADACGKVLAETALEDLRVSPTTLERLAGSPRRGGIGDWRELWPKA